MNLRIPPGLLHATRLVRDGKLMEATHAIQRTLRGDAAAPAPESGQADPDDLAIEGYARVVGTDGHTLFVEDDGYTQGVEVETPERTEGEFISRSHTSAAGTREYKIYVPGVYEGQALPVVIMLHGCQQEPDDFAAATRMNALADEHGFVVVYPRQPCEANGSKCWNWFSGSHQQRERGEPALIAGITREVLAAYALDARRVYVAGLSAGGAMAAIMATTYPEMYAAVGIHSGLAYAAARDLPSAVAAMRGEQSKPRRRKTPAGTSSRTVPTIVFHGDSDTVVHPSNGDDVIAQASPNESTRESPFVTFDRTVEHGDTGGRAYTRTTYRDSTGKPVMEQWVVHGAAHAWSGGSAEGSFADPSGPDASREMVRFFLQHRNT